MTRQPAWAVGPECLPTSKIPQPEAASNIESEKGFREGAANAPEADAQVVRHDGSVAGLWALLDRLLKRPAPPTAYVVTKPVHVLTLVVILRGGACDCQRTR